jgi:hypothetical protein
MGSPELSMPFKNIDALTDHLNQALFAGQAVQFFNNGGIFVRQGLTSIHQFTMRGITVKSAKNGFFTHIGADGNKYITAYGAVYKASYPIIADFFKCCKNSDMYPFDFLQTIPGIRPDDPLLCYGYLSESLDVKKHRAGLMSSCLDSPIYGPRIGRLVPTCVDSLFFVQGEYRAYVKRD